eukprot:UN23074
MFARKNSATEFSSSEVLSPLREKIFLFDKDRQAREIDRRFKDQAFSPRRRSTKDDSIDKSVKFNQKYNTVHNLI